MADSTEELRFRALGEDVSAGKMLGKLGDKADDAKDEIKQLDRQLGKLDEQLDLTKLHLVGLIKEFDKTGDKTLFRDIRKDRSALSLIQAMKKELEEDPPKQNWFSKLFDNVGDTLGSLPSELKGGLIIGAVGAAVAVGPLVGAAIGGAVLGGVGAGGIIGGVALAARDPRVQAAGSELGKRLLSELQASAQPFVGPLLSAFEQLEDTGRTVIGGLGREFTKLAPTLSPLVRGIDGLITRLGPGMAKAFARAIPVLHAVAEELPDVGDAFSDMLEMIADESEGGTEGLISLLHAVEDTARAIGFFTATLEGEYNWLVDTGAALHDFAQAHDLITQNFGAIFLLATDEAKQTSDAYKAAASSADTYVGSVGYLADSLEEQAKAAELARNAMVELADSIADQFSPTANLVHRLQDLKETQKAYNEAVKEHGRNSREAKDAELAMADAIIKVNSAAAAASGTFDGRFDPALHKILHDGGLTEAQIRDLEKSFRVAQAAGDRFAKTYKAQLVLDLSKFYGSLAAARNAAEGNSYVSGRASGGDVSGGRTYMVGENGPELVTFGQDGYVHDAADTRAMMSGSSGGSAGGWSGGSAQPVVIAFPGPSGDPIFDAVVRRLREGVRVEGAGNVTVFFGGSS